MTTLLPPGPLLVQAMPNVGPALHAAPVESIDQNPAGLAIFPSQLFLKVVT